MTIIEFIGSPGSGKSSICNRTMDHFEDMGLKVGNIHRDEIRKGAVSRKILSAKSKFMPCTSSLRSAITEYTSKVPEYHGSVWERDLLNAAYKLSCPYVRAMDYAFFDEGPTQYVSAMMNGIPINDDILPLIDTINDSIYKCDVIAFFIQLDVDSIVERISKRNRSGDIYLSDDVDDMRSRITLKENNLRYLAEHLNYKEIHYIDNIELENAALQVQTLIEAKKRKK